jgi:hypothetical protein
MLLFNWTFCHTTEATMLSLCLTVVTLLGLSAAQTINDCPASVFKDKFLKLHGGICYQFVLDIPLDYNTALDDCKAHGGTLVLDKSKDVTDFLIDQLIYELGDGSKIWIGLNDKTTEGTYVWEDGTTLSDYTNWAPGRNSSNQLHDCVNFDPSKNGAWEEDFCKDLIFGLFLYERPYVCQYKTRGTVTKPPTK